MSGSTPQISLRGGHLQWANRNRHHPGLKIVAVAIVAQAVWGMAKNLCPDKERATISLIAILVVIAVAGSLGQVSAIAAGAVAGLSSAGPQVR